MIKVFISLFFLFGIALGGLNPYTRDSVSTISANATHLRQYNATWFPDNDPRIIILEGVEIDVNLNSSSVEVDAVVFFLDNFNQTTLFFEYFEAHVHSNMYGNLTDVTAAAFAFAIRTLAVFEYVEVNGVPGFQNGSSDYPTGIYDLSNIFLQWKPMQINQSTIIGEGNIEYNVWSVTIQTLDEVFLMRFIISGTPISVNGVDLTPTTMKIDYQINWFTSKHVPALWTTGPSNPNIHPHAMVGMGLVAAANAQQFAAHSSGNGGGADNSSFEFQAGNFTGFFSWETSADVTVQGVEAGGAVMFEQQEIGNGHEAAEGFAAEWLVRVIWFSFEGFRPSSVFWDPEMGAQTNNDQSTSTSSPASTTTASATSAQGSTATSAQGSTATSGSATSQAASEDNGAANVIPALSMLLFAIAFAFKF